MLILIKDKELKTPYENKTLQDQQYVLCLQFSITAAILCPQQGPMSVSCSTHYVAAANVVEDIIKLRHNI